MKVFYDYQIFVRQRYGGISRYFQQLILNLLKISASKDGVMVGTLLGQNQYISEIPGKFTSSSLRQYFPLPEFRGKFLVLNNLNKIFFSPQMAFADYQIFHPTYYDPYFLPILKLNNYLRRSQKCQLVVTVFDMIHELYPQSFCKRDHTIANKRLLLDRADKVIAISHNTKKDILSFYPKISSQKIEVIHLASSFAPTHFSPLPPLPPLPSLPPLFMLFVGRREIYKNFKRTLQAVAPLLLNGNYSDLQLLCFGGGAFSKSEVDFIRELALLEKVKQIDGDDNLLKLLYQHALCFIFPSCYEGFGIPILEAFACECPLLCSNSSSFPEVAGDAALYFDPTDPLSMRAAVEKMLDSEEIRREFRSKGRKQLLNFSWEKMAKQTLDVYSS